MVGPQPTSSLWFPGTVLATSTWRKLVSLPMSSLAPRKFRHQAAKLARVSDPSNYTFSQLTLGGQNGPPNSVISPGGAKLWPCGLLGQSEAWFVRRPKPRRTSHFLQLKNKHMLCTDNSLSLNISITYGGFLK